MNASRTRRAAIYVRVSTGSQTTENQLRELRQVTVTSQSILQRLDAKRRFHRDRYAPRQNPRLTPAGHQPRSTPPSAPAGPMRVSFNGDLLEVSAVLADAEAVDRLVKALQANKALLPEKKAPDVKDEAAN